MADPHPTMNGHLGHGSWHMETEEVQLTRGNLLVGFCSECHLVVAECEHFYNTWNEQETHLTCDLCGIDGT